MPKRLKIFQTPFFLLVFLTTIWGTQYHVIKFSITQIPGPVSVFYRFLLVFIICQVILFLKHKESPSGNFWNRLVLASSRAIAFLLVYQAQKLLLGSQTMTLLLLHPIIVFLLAPILLKNEHYSLKGFWGILLGLTGAWIFVASFPESTSSITNAVFLTLLAAVFLGITKIYSKRAALKDSPYLILRDLSFVSCVTSYLVMHWKNYGFAVDTLLSEAWPAIVFLGLFCSFFANLAFFNLIKRISITKYSYMAFVYVAVAFLIDVGLGNQMITTSTLLGLFILFGGGILLKKGMKKQTV